MPHQVGLGQCFMVACEVGLKSCSTSLTFWSFFEKFERKNIHLVH